MKTVPDEFIAFLRTAPVSSGICCCGGREGSCDGHAFVDQWDWSLSGWLDQINAPTHIHTKTQKAVQFIGEAQMQTRDWEIPIHDESGYLGGKIVDMEKVVVYQEPDGKIWVRPVEEFNERFSKDQLS